ncbi:MAG: DNA adenine methylase [Kofleriaceae bacterium]
MAAGPAQRVTSSAPARTLSARRAPLPIGPAPVPAAPIIKWVGGKTRLMPELLARVPARFGRYYEAFIGGAALFFRLAPARAVISDMNPDLVGLYRAVGADPDGVIRRLELHRAAHGKEHYYATRARWNDPSVSWTVAERAAAFVYLNKTCFNGLWRVNRAGHFNVPMGSYVSPPICVPDALRVAAGALRAADIRLADFRAAVADARRGDFLYFDPPYDPVTPTANFTGYTAGAFGMDEQRALATLAAELVDRGCQVMLSNSDTPRVRALYAGFKIDRVQCPRAINSNAARRGDVDEVLITGGYRPSA